MNTHRLITLITLIANLNSSSLSYTPVNCNEYVDCSNQEGLLVEPKLYPFVVGLFKRNEPNIGKAFLCTASIITEHLVLTASYCLYKDHFVTKNQEFSPSDLEVRLFNNQWNLLQPNDVRLIKSWLHSPEFVLNSTLGYISLIQLSSPVRVNFPIKLVLSESDKFNVTIKLIGWSLSSQTNRLLLKASYHHLLSSDDCLDRTFTNSYNRLLCMESISCKTPIDWYSGLLVSCDEPTIIGIIGIHQNYCNIDTEMEYNLTTGIRLAFKYNSDWIHHMVKKLSW